MKNINSRLEPFCGNDPLCESEHGGELLYKKRSYAENFLIPTSELKKRLHDYAMQVQQAVNGRKETEESIDPIDEVV